MVIFAFAKHVVPECMNDSWITSRSLNASIWYERFKSLHTTERVMSIPVSRCSCLYISVTRSSPWKSCVTIICSPFELHNFYLFKDNSYNNDIHRSVYISSNSAASGDKDWWFSSLCWKEVEPHGRQNGRRRGRIGARRPMRRWWLSSPIATWHAHPIHRFDGREAVVSTGPC
jgi:hypothetical protein